MGGLNESSSIQPTFEKTGFLNPTCGEPDWLMSWNPF